MDGQDVIALCAGLIAFGLWASLKRRSAAKMTAALVLALPVASHFAYPDRYSDAMWLIGAVFAFFFQLAAVVVAAAIGCAIRLVITHATWQDRNRGE
jgi:hypothetical protein